MTRKRKSMAGMGKGIDAYFEETAQEEEPKSQHTDIQTKQHTTPILERATFYIWPNHHTTLEELKINLRKQKIKTNKSELLRMAIDLLAEQELETVAERLTSK